MTAPRIMPLLAQLAAMTVATGIFLDPASGQTSRPDAPGAPTPPATQPSPGRTAAAAAGVGHLVRRIERAHGAAAWQRAAVVRADLHVHYDGTDMVRGLLRYDIRGGRVRIDLDGGATLVYDGGSAWVSPATAEVSMARFQLLTWPYFLAAPFKLRDPGARVRSNGLQPFGGKLCETLRLTFAPGTGDSPDDWYVVYIDPAADRIAAMAYIVTYGTSASEAENDPHAIVYDGYSRVDGVMLSTRWQFRSWSPEAGIADDELGWARLQNVRFEPLDETLFQKPTETQEDKRPE